MASWADQGHAMRRREGNPSSHLESAGKSMARTHQTSEEAYEETGKNMGTRVPMNEMNSMDEVNKSQMKGLKGTLVKKKSTQAADPTYGGKANRANIEKAGASYRITAKVDSPLIDPAVGPTMANARTVPSVRGRNTNFSDEMKSSSY
jgi:hypothetical protein